jgi:alanine dehydrogenase
MIIGIISTSTKKNERRYPLHVDHIRGLPRSEREQMIFETGYPGLEELHDPSIKTLPREEVFRQADLVIIAKPTKKDFPYLKEGQMIWGWPHCVQNPDITEVGIKKKLTFIAWESMFKWKNNVRQEHIFSRNNELAGYASVIHALTIKGLTGGVYGQKLHIAVIGYGSTGKGAINALLGLGAYDVTVYSRRSRYELADALPRVNYKKYHVSKGRVIMDGKASNQELKSYDVIVNCVLQNPLKPMMFLRQNDIMTLDHSQLIIDVSCDAGMGFEFARPTTFDAPSFDLGPATYYAVNHSPSFFYQAASYELSGALLPYLRYLITHGTYEGNEVLEAAVAIEKGLIKHDDILKFQNRDETYPYRIKPSSIKG